MYDTVTSKISKKYFLHQNDVKQGPLVEPG